MGAIPKSKVRQLSKVSDFTQQMNENTEMEKLFESCKNEWFVWKLARDDQKHSSSVGSRVPSYFLGWIQKVLEDPKSPYNSISEFVRMACLRQIGIDLEKIKGSSYYVHWQKERAKAWNQNIMEHQKVYEEDMSTFQRNIEQLSRNKDDKIFLKGYIKLYIRDHVNKFGDEYWQDKYEVKIRKILEHNYIEDIDEYFEEEE